MALDLTKPWSEYPVLALDFEATSADPETCEPVEVAAVRFEGGIPVGRYSSLLKPSAPIPPAATAVHGIDDEMVRCSPMLVDIIHHVLELAVDAVPLAYNASYDKQIMTRYITPVDCPTFDPGFNWLDVYVIAASPKQDRYTTDAGRLKLAEVCKRHSVELSNAHRAEGDAEAAGRLFYALMGTSKATMESVLARMVKAREEHDADYRAWRKREMEAERLIWRQYACAALSGTCSREDSTSMQNDFWRSEIASEVADRMLAKERERLTLARADRRIDWLAGSPWSAK